MSRPPFTGPASSDSFVRILESIRKPIRYATKDSFAGLKTLKSLGPLIKGLCREAKDLGLIQKSAEAFGRMEGLFDDFDSIQAEEKIKRLGIAAALIEEIEKISSSSALSDTQKDAPLTPSELAGRFKALETPLQFVKGVGPKLAERLAKKGLNVVEDMLYFLPIRYEDRRNVRKIRDLKPGAHEAVIASVLACAEAYYGARRVFEVAFDDGTGIMKAKWFHFRASYMRERFKAGKRFSVYGRVGAYGRQMEMIHPDTEPIEDEAQPGDVKDNGAIVPVYSQIENFHQKTIRKIAASVVENFADSAVDALPLSARARHGVMSTAQAFRRLHCPDSASLDMERKTLALDELFMLELGLSLKRAAIKSEPGISFSKACGPNVSAMEARLRRALHFKLTGAQERVLSEIRADMSAPNPMNRLIQGDVGSGKTVVSMISALLAIESGYQAAIMAPTEILAEQHYHTIRRYADIIGINAALVTGSGKKSEKEAIAAGMACGEVQLAVGTHALIQKDISFNRLGLVVIDEQHRFGVVQRAMLRKKGSADIIPDVLIMTATPIPRTLSMTVFGDLDVSVIDELPPGRTPIRTRIVREKERGRAYATIREGVSSGRQCYIVYPLVEESEELSLKDATRMKEHLAKDVFQEFKVGLMHGKLKPTEKEAVMADFKGGKIDILVCTTVIEVGVDVPNATVILVEHAERFGLAQLHQLRGRVGRGDKSSVCLLLAAWTHSEDAYARLKVMEETMDGFKIAEHDLKIRGPGSFLGTRQAGLPDFRTAFALGDLRLLKAARDEAMRFLRDDPRLESAQGRVLRAILNARWAERLELSKTG